MTVSTTVLDAASPRGIGPELDLDDKIQMGAPTSAS